MCTAIVFNANHRLFGRTLDLEQDYGEHITHIPQNRPLCFRHIPPLTEHFAMLGMALDLPEFPLFFDGMNDAGLAVAGLNFPQSAHYAKSDTKGCIPLASFEMIPYLLATCRTVAEAKASLRQIRILDTSYSSAYPTSPLHWMVTDGQSSIVIEPMEEGLVIYDNPIGILTNEPPFPHHLYALSAYLHLSSQPQLNMLGLELGQYSDYSRGMGAIGLPGDNSSVSRFIRAAFNTACASKGENQEEDITQFYHIAASVAQIKGCVRLNDGSEIRTIYTSCCDLDAGRYYLKRYEQHHLFYDDF